MRKELKQRLNKRLPDLMIPMVNLAMGVLLLGNLIPLLSQKLEATG